MRVRLVLLLVVPPAYLLAGCGGGGSGAGQTSSPTASAAASEPGGLVGVIGQARVTAACTNIQQASTFVSAGIGDQADEMLLAAADQLEKPPRVQSAIRLATALRADVQGGQESAAVDAGLDWCDQNGG